MLPLPPPRQPPRPLPPAIAAREANCCGLRTRKALRLVLDPRDSIFAHLEREFGDAASDAGALSPASALARARHVVDAAAAAVSVNTISPAAAQPQNHINSSDRAVASSSSPSVERIPGESIVSALVPISSNDLITATPPPPKRPADVTRAAPAVSSSRSPGKFSDLLFPSPAKVSPLPDCKGVQQQCGNEDAASTDRAALQPQAPVKLVELFDHEFAISRRTPHAVPLEDNEAATVCSPPGSSSAGNHTAAAVDSTIDTVEHFTSSVAPLPPLTMVETTPRAQREFEIVIPPEGTAPTPC